ncbi:MAG TPA: protoglobin domain-containing protein [Cytophagaceae bacterium]
MQKATIAGYSYGNSSLAQSPISLKDLDLLKKTLLFTEEDEKYLGMAGEVLSGQVESILDVWYNFVGQNEHLAYYFSKDGQPDAGYLAAVRARFGQWIIDLCFKKYDQEWLNYQYEIALRHHSTKKNKTDAVDSVPIINVRYIIAFIFPITYTIKPFLSKSGHSEEEIEKMYNAWFKAVTLTATLWSYPFVKEGEY